MKLFDAPPVPRAVRLAGYRPAPYKPAPVRAKLAEFSLRPEVNVNPNVKVEAPINIDLGGLPLSIGLFTGSGVVFLMRTALPPGWMQTAALVVGGGLAAGGVLNLFAGKAHAEAGPGARPGAPSGPSAAPTSPQGGISAQEIQPAMSDAFAGISGILTSPQDFSTVNVHSWSSTYPVRIQLHNGSSQPVNFILELQGNESGSLGADNMASYVAQVTLNPSETKNVDIDMPVVSGHVLDTVDVALKAFKRRVAGEPAEMLSMRTFILK